LCGLRGDGRLGRPGERSETQSLKPAPGAPPFSRFLREGGSFDF
jgi:hypothetical protein